jgi:hypothetical protein
MDRPRAADDFDTIRHRLDELRREREALAVGQDGNRGKRGNGRDTDLERRRRERLEGWPPPWAPTIFVKSARR